MQSFIWPSYTWYSTLLTKIILMFFPFLIDLSTNFLTYGVVFVSHLVDYTNLPLNLSISFNLIFFSSIIIGIALYFPTSVLKAFDKLLVIFSTLIVLSNKCLAYILPCIFFNQLYAPLYSISISFIWLLYSIFV